MVLAAALFAAAPSARARTLRRGCFDGVLVRRLCVVGCQPLQCDVDQACDRLCTFALKVCGEVACHDETLVVPVGEKTVVRLATAFGEKPTKFILRCRRHPPDLPCSSTTTTTTTTTTSTAPLPAVCQTDADCQTGNPCGIDFCGAGQCVNFCSCLHNGGFTCSPDLADPCPSSDCHPLLGDPCVHCAEDHLCKSHPLCV